MNRRKTVVIVGLAIIAFAARQPLYQQFSEIHPSDPARATALARCGMDDRFFNVLSADARTACYDKWLAGDPIPDPTLRVPDQIDLKRDAASIATAAMVPKEDIPKRQAADFYHPR
ncbi:MAG TPA: hypothetical protein VNV38_02955 [Stellaceae bacterium]|jgi:hypothetical protein|nr:hypothetical protein [Stellaceae bacterium]